MTKWIATLAGMIGALFVAMNSGLQFFGYIGFVIGSIIWLYHAIKSKDYAAVTQWGFFSMVNLVGIIQYAK